MYSSSSSSDIEKKPGAKETAKGNDSGIDFWNLEFSLQGTYPLKSWYIIIFSNSYAQRQSIQKYESITATLIHTTIIP